MLKRVSTVITVLCSVALLSPSGVSAAGPRANAGENQDVLEGQPVTLDGSRSFDPDGDPITFFWEQRGGPPVVISDPGSPRPTFRAPLVEKKTELSFRLTVSAPRGRRGNDDDDEDDDDRRDRIQTDRDDVKVHVLNTVPSPNPENPEPEQPNQPEPEQPNHPNPPDPDPPNPPSGGLTSFDIFPNPCDVSNRDVNFQYELGGNSDITLTVYDAFGNLVRTFERSAGTEGGQAGLNRWSWDARNGRGEKVANGAYVVQIISVDAHGVRQRINERLAVVK